MAAAPGLGDSLVKENARKLLAYGHLTLRATSISTSAYFVRHPGGAYEMRATSEYGTGLTMARISH
jgi:hypothetical protein